MIDENSKRGQSNLILWVSGYSLQSCARVGRSVSDPPTVCLIIISCIRSEKFTLQRCLLFPGWIVQCRFKDPRFFLAECMKNTSWPKVKVGIDKMINGPLLLQWRNYSYSPAVSQMGDNFRLRARLCLRASLGYCFLEPSTARRTTHCPNTAIFFTTLYPMKVMAAQH